MNALPSANRLEAKINFNFVVKVRYPNDPDWSLTTARKLSQHLKNEEMKNKLFKRVLEGGQYQYTFKIRNRLKIKFHSK